jgi:hypothetical protein
MRCNAGTCRDPLVPMSAQVVAKAYADVDLGDGRPASSTHALDLDGNR